MDEYTIKTAIAVGVVVLIGGLWLVWKFFYKFFKHVVIALLIGAAGATIYYLRSLPPPPPSHIGKHAYLVASGKYLGVVEGQGKDRERGEVWIVRPPGGYTRMYSKSRVTLKDKRDPEAEAESTPAVAPTQASTPQPANNPPKKN